MFPRLRMPQKLACGLSGCHPNPTLPDFGKELLPTPVLQFLLVLVLVLVLVLLLLLALERCVREAELEEGDPHSNWFAGAGGGLLLFFSTDQRERRFGVVVAFPFRAEEEEEEEGEEEEEEEEEEGERPLWALWLPWFSFWSLSLSSLSSLMSSSP